MEVVKDHIGQPIKVGDLVVSALTGRDPYIAIYEITSLDGRYPNSLECERYDLKVKKTNTRAYDQVIKIDGSLVTFMELNK